MTGSTSGIGRGIAEHFAGLGSNIVVHGRDRADGLETVRRVKAAGREAEYFDGDLTSEEVCRGLIRFAVERFGGLDILVNNAADTGRGDLEHIAVARWDTIMAVNLRAPFILLQESIAPMRARGGGSVINIGSVLAYVGEPKLGAYSVSKGGLMTLTKNAASLLNRDRIRVNQINVGWTLTEGERRVKREQEGKGDEWIEEAIATRPVRPDARAARYRLRGGVLRVERERMRHRKRPRPRTVPAGRAAELVIGRDAPLLMT